MKIYLKSQEREKTASVSLLEEEVDYHKDMAANESTVWSRELFLLSHLVFSILKNRGVSVQPVKKSFTITASFKKLAHQSPGFKFLPIAQYPNLVNYFPNDKINTKHFVLTFQNLGQVNITPSPTFSKCFIQKIWFCRPTAQSFKSEICKVTDSFVKKITFLCNNVVLLIGSKTIICHFVLREPFVSPTSPKKLGNRKWKKCVRCLL